MIDNKIKGYNRKRRTDTENFYIKSSDIFDQWKLWKDSAVDVHDRIPSAMLCNQILQIAQGIARKSSFRDYSEELRQDMISDALVKCLKNLKNMKEDRKDSFFAYLCRCVHCSFISTLDKHYKQINIKKKLLEEARHALSQETYGQTDIDLD